MRKLLFFLPFFFIPKLNAYDVIFNPYGGHNQYVSTLDSDTIKGSSVAATYVNKNNAMSGTSTTTWSGTNFFIGSTSIMGTATNNDACSGCIGQYISSQTSGGSILGSSNQWADLVSTTVPAGDWDMNVCINISPAGATITENLFGISSTAGNSSSGMTKGITQLEIFPGTSAADSSGCIPNVRLSLNSNTLYYLKMFAIYAVATPKATGTINGRRRR